MQYTVKNDTPFQILTSAIVIGPSQTGYQLEVAADGKNFSPLFTVGANVTRQVTNLSSGAYYRLNGNVGDVIVNWVRSCVTPGGSGGAGNELTPVTEFPLGAEAGTVVALASGDTYGIYQYDGTNWNPAGGDVDLSAYWTSAQTKDYVDEAVSGISLEGYWTSAETQSAITQSVSGKADAANLSSGDTNSGELWFPKWNEQGIITGKTGARNFQIIFDINGFRNHVTSPDNGYIPSIYAPSNAGNPGEVLVSVGANQAPIWSAVTIPDVSEFYTSAETEEKIASAVTPVEVHIADVERVTASALTELHQDMGSLSAVVQEQQIVFSSGYNELHTQVLELSARTAPDMSAYTPTTGFSTINGSAITNGGNLVIQGGGVDLSDYYTSAQTEEKIASAVTPVEDHILDVERVTASALTELHDQIDTMDEVVSAALVDLEGKKVESQDIRHMVKLTQAQYDALVTKDPETFYIIVNSN